jgi:hypothetical protein
MFVRRNASSNNTKRLFLFLNTLFFKEFKYFNLLKIVQCSSLAALQKKRSGEFVSGSNAFAGKECEAISPWREIFADHPCARAHRHAKKLPPTPSS